MAESCVGRVEELTSELPKALADGVSDTAAA